LNVYFRLFVDEEMAYTEQHRSNLGAATSSGESPGTRPDAPRRRLDSWKEIASYLNRSEKTVRRWEENEGLPVHRLVHEKRSTVYAYCGELDAWWNSRQSRDGISADSLSELPENLERKRAIAAPEKQAQPEIRSPTLADIDETEIVDAGEPKVSAPVRPRHTALIISVLIFIIGFLAAIYGAGFRESMRMRSSPSRIHSLAVLPMENLSGDREQEYFADGMTAELITELGKISSIRVISRTSVMRYKGVRKPLTQVARELHVDAVVEGEVLRSNDRVRVTAQLIDTAEDRHIWAEAYNRDLRDVLALQGDIAQSIANAIRARVTPAELTRLTSDRRIDPKTYELYLKARYFLEKRTSEGSFKAATYFQQTIDKDPQFAEAYAGLAKTYQILGSYELLPPNESYPKVREMADKALQLDNALSEAYAARGLSTTYYEHDWSAAEQDFQHAFAVNSNDALAHHWYAEHLITVGKVDRGIAELERARDLDPLSLPINATLGRAYRDARRYKEAVDQCRKSLDLDPDFPLSRWCLGVAYVGMKHYAEAVTEMQRASAVGASPLYLCGLGYAYAAAGNKVKARAVIDALKQRTDKTYLPAYFIASIYGELGEKQHAFDWLQRGYNERDPQVAYLVVDPFMDPLRSDPRFDTLVRKFGFPQ
jgi:TolB-like protein/Tfp pilus assembly protein PilF